MSAVVRDWYKSSRSVNEPSCVETRFHADGTVDVRNSNDPAGGTLTFTPEEWVAFTGGVRNNEFDLP